MSLLTEADALINGDRDQQYGTPLDNWTKTADLVNALLSHKLIAPLTPEELVLVMIQVKVAREIHKPKRDTRIDLAGYAGVLERIITERGE